jgi:hypothetical protein
LVAFPGLPSAALHHEEPRYTGIAFAVALQPEEPDPLVADLQDDARRSNISIERPRPVSDMDPIKPVELDLTQLVHGLDLAFGRSLRDRAVSRAPVCEADLIGNLVVRPALHRELYGTGSLAPSLSQRMHDASWLQIITSVKPHCVARST